MAKIIEPPQIPLEVDLTWLEDWPLFRANVRKIGKVGALMALHGRCALLSFDRLAKVGPMLELAHFPERHFPIQMPIRYFNGVTSADTLSDGCTSQGCVVEENASGELVVNIADQTEFDINGNVTRAIPNNINLTLIGQAVNRALAERDENELTMAGVVDLNTINEWQDDIPPIEEGYDYTDAFIVGFIYFYQRQTRKKSETHVERSYPTVVAFTQGTVGASLKVSIRLDCRVSSYAYQDPAGRNGKLSLNTFIDWELLFIPIQGEWANTWTLPLVLGSSSIIAKGSFAVKVENASEVVNVNVKVPSSRLGILMLKPIFNEGTKYLPYVSDALYLTNVTTGMSNDLYQKVMKQQIDYGVSLTATVQLSAATYS